MSTKFQKRNSGFRKHGRSEKREIRRARKKTKTEDVPETLPEPQSESESDPEASSPQDGASISSTQTYNALLTLLKTGDKKPEPEAEEAEGTATVEQPHVEYGIEEDEEDEEDEDEILDTMEQPDSDDSDVDDESGNDAAKGAIVADPFKVHFDSPDESILDSLQGKTVSWKSTKYTVGGHSVIEQEPQSKLPSVSGTSLDTFKVKSRLARPESLIEELVNSIFNYKDVVYPYDDYKNEASVRDTYCLHAMNHIMKTRDTILRNNMKLSNFREQLHNGKAKIADEPELRDQGFNRAKVLILLPTREACHDVVMRLIKISGLSSVENKKRFTSQYSSQDTVPSYKPQDFKHLFNGNSNDFFCIGAKLTRKTFKLFSAFSQSDVIFASPLGLRTFLEKKTNLQHVSSIEVLIMDQANSLQYQNWANVSFVLKNINKIPESYNDSLDFSRIRMWAINDQARYLRQNLVFCKFATPEMNSVLSQSLNLAGKLKFRSKIEGEVGKIVLKVKQSFQRFASESPVNDMDARFKFFKTNVVPQLSEDEGVLVYVPEYSDYVRLKAFLKYETSLDFCAIDEYSSQSKMTRNRNGFANGKYRVMLYTERLHHYNRFEIKGVKNIVFYQPPGESAYYTEVVLRFLSQSMMSEYIKDISLSYVKVLYSKWDVLGLERVVGSDKVGMLMYGTDEKYVFK